LHWCDNTETSRDLNENPASSSVERVKYLPQSYLETLCNELAQSGSSTFDAELRKIIYTHVPVEERMDFQSLDELLDFKVSELEAERQQIVQALSKLNSEIVAVEKKLAPGFRASLEQQLAAKRNELVALEAARPVPVEDPLEAEDAKEDSARAAARLAELELVLKQLDADETAARLKKGDAIKRAAHVSRILQAIKNHKKAHDQFVAELDTMLVEVSGDIKANSIIQLNIDTSAIEKLAATFKEISEQQDAILTNDSDSSLLRRRQLAEAEVREIKGRLGEKQRLFLVYKEQLGEWERAKSDLQGDENKLNTINWYLAEIRTLETLPNKRDALKVSRSDAAKKIHAQLEKIVAEYRLLYQPVQNFVQSAASMEMPLPLDFNVQIAQEGFQENFLGRVNRQARGSFSGVDESNLLIRTLLQETDFMNVESVLAFVEKIDDMLHFDRRDEPPKRSELSVVDQLRKGNQPEQLYDYIFGLQYLLPKYSLTFSGQEISQLSPGERGLLLLVFYLLVDKDDIPLVIDQPEENLDNQTIYKVLVKCVKTAKQKRQVIMVTHNPNLAVVCDAEQIIYASCEKAAKVLSYESGAIEAPHIKARVVEILEGTEPAFVNRKQKYGY
jgi:predicted ATPase